MTLVEIIGTQHLRILALEETVARMQNENSRLQERVMQLTPTGDQDDAAQPGILTLLKEKANAADR
jgi:hypothetical protein